MKELIENIDFYINEDGYMVLTEKYHLERDIVAVIAANTACINMKIFQSPAVHLYFPQITTRNERQITGFHFPSRERQQPLRIINSAKGVGQKK